MYGTVGRVKLKAEKREQFRQTLESQGNASIPGFQKAWLMFHAAFLVRDVRADLKQGSLLRWNS